MLLLFLYSLKNLPSTTKGLIQTGKNGEISWELDRGQEESGPNGEVGLAVCNSLEDLDEQNLC